MKNRFSKCGCNCGRCPSYKGNLRTDEDRQRCSDGWHKYLGIRLSPGTLRPCDGCQTPDDENPVRYLNCYVRKCAVRNGVETCAHCSGYPCEDVKNLHAMQKAGARERIAARLGTPVPDGDYLAFIEPYEGIKHLDAIRASLGPEDIVEVTKVSARPKLVDFPNDLPFSREETSAFEALHRLLAAVESVDGVSYARQTAIKKRRQHLLKILWAFGLFGEPWEEGGSHLVLDSETYLAQKIHSSYSRVQDYCKALEAYGVHCQHVRLAKEGWLTPTGALRREGWCIRMSFDDDAGGVSALEALQSYSAKLDEKYGKRAFRYFSKVDMRVLGGGG
jgi:hypothetical protein